MLSPVQLRLENLPSAEAIDEARDQIQDRLAENGSRLARLNWQIMRNAAGGALRDALGKLDPLESIAGAWCTALELQALARKTLDAPGTEEPLSLLQQDPSVVLSPVVKIKCGPFELPALTFELKLGAAVECAVLIVAGGKLAAIEAASFIPYAQLSYDGQELKKLNGTEALITGRYDFPNGGIPIPCRAEGEMEPAAA